MSENTYAVKYLRNADSYEGTGAVRFRDGRPDLVIGSPPVEITEDEYKTLSSNGLILEVVDKNQLSETATIEYANREPGDGLDEVDDLNDLKEIAKSEGVDLAGARSKDAVREAIRASRAEAQETGLESLPATATIEGTHPPVGGGPTVGEESGTSATGDGGTATIGAGT